MNDGKLRKGGRRDKNVRYTQMFYDEEWCMVSGEAVAIRYFSFVFANAKVHKSSNHGQKPEPGKALACLPTQVPQRYCMIVCNSSTRLYFYEAGM